MDPKDTEKRDAVREQIKAIRAEAEERVARLIARHGCPDCGGWGAPQGCESCGTKCMGG